MTSQYTAAGTGIAAGIRDANTDGDGNGDDNGDSSHSPYTRANVQYNILYQSFVAEQSYIILYTIPTKPPPFLEGSFLCFPFA